MEIEQTARQIESYLQKQPGQSLSAMHLKLALEISASKLFLALGWLLKEGRVELDKDEYGAVARLAGPPGVLNVPGEREPGTTRPVSATCLQVEEPLTQKIAEV